MGDFDAENLLRRRARRMRMTPTKAEVRLWRRLRKKRLLGLRFRRQHILKPYIVDFYCASEKLVIEVDGAVHSGDATIPQDDVRTRYLERNYDVQVIRFSNHDVLERTEAVVEKIRDTVGDL